MEREDSAEDSYEGGGLRLLKQKKFHQKFEIRTPAILGAVFVIALIGLYIYYIRTGQAHHFLLFIRSLGWFGVIVGILSLALLNVIPVPAEFISIFLMEIYGVWQGFLFSILAGVIGAIAALYISRLIARPLVERVARKHLNKVDRWLKSHGTFGLFAIRFIPLVPYHLVNYTCGILNVRLWPFAWTTLLGIIPYNLALAGMFAGFRYGSMKWGFIGGGIFIILVGLGWVMRKQFQRIETKK